MTGLGNITIYAHDPPALARFWCGVFGYPVQTWDEPLRSELRDPEGNEFCLQ